MRKRASYLWAGIIVLILMVFYSLSNFSIQNILPKTPLPNQYKNYSEIDQTAIMLYRSAIETRLDDFPPLLNTKDNTVFLNKVNKNQSKTYLKLDADGNLTDSLTYEDDYPNEWAGYLVSPKGYCSWIINGDKKLNQFEEENSDLREDSATIDKHFQRLYQSAVAVYYFSYYELYDRRLDSLQIDKVLFLQQGRWIALLGKNLSGNQTAHPNKGYGLLTVLKNVAGKAVQAEYFQKDHFSKASGPPLGSPTGLSSPDEWSGTGYFKIIFQKDTLHFKQDLTESNRQLHTYVPLCYFTAPQLHFALFSNNGNDVYLIKNKFYFKSYQIYRRGDTSFINTKLNGQQLTIILNGKTKTSIIADLSNLRKLNLQVALPLDSSLVVDGKIAQYKGRPAIYPQRIYIGKELKIEKHD